jgi:hypothetical protein
LQTDFPPSGYVLFLCFWRKAGGFEDVEGGILQDTLFSYYTRIRKALECAY